MTQEEGITKKFLDYWRASLIDGQSDPSAFEKNYAAHCLNLDVKTLPSGRVLPVDPDTVKGIRDEPIEVLIYPFVYDRSSYHSEAHQTGFSFYLAPILIHAEVAPDGRISAINRVAIGRDVLEPNAREGFTVGSMQDMDTFLQENPFPPISWQDPDTQEDVIESTYRRRWAKVLDYCQRLIDSMPRGPAFIRGSGQYSKANIWLVKVVDGGGASRAILTLYDCLLEQPTGKPLLDRFAQIDAEPLAPCAPISLTDQWGHSNPSYPLAPAQREVIASLSRAKDGQVLVVNGPPGTGKTTLLLSAVASLWVKAAIDDTPPPLIIASSTNNQAVTNVIDAFGAGFKNEDGTPVERWLPGLESFGLFLASKARAKDASQKYQTLESMEDLETFDYLEVAEPFFLRRTKTDTVGEAVTALRSKILATAKTLRILEAGRQAVERRRQILRQHLIDHYDGHPFREACQEARTRASATRRQAQLFTEAAQALLAHQAAESWVLALFAFIPAIERKRHAQYLLCLHDGDVLEALGQTHSVQSLIDLVGIKSRQVNAHADAEETKVEVLARLDAELQDESRRWRQAFHEILPGLGQTGDAELADINDALDVTLRFRLFTLAVHYWEGRWLMEMEKTQAYQPEQKKKTGASAKRALWHMRMMLTPCAVSTFYTLPGRMGCTRHRKGKFVEDYLFNEIDWLIVDEAGQVLPEVAAVSFSLAKKALVVGDVDQIAPIYGVTNHLDRGNLVLAGLLDGTTNEKGFETLAATGKLASGGSVMATAQHVTPHHQHPDLYRGLYLVEHRRCFDEIIAYCNALCYDGVLEPKRGSRQNAESAVQLPAMGYLHVPGRCQKTGPGSRENLVEAATIAQWVAEHCEELEASYGKAIGEIVGVVTPFAGQKAAIGQAFARVGLLGSSITVGTVHALQGAERPVVLFSPTYSKHSTGGFIDSDRRMLNVAVSRAKDSFLVFGDMDLFDPSSVKPTGLLARHLFADKDNELAPVKPPERYDLKGKETSTIFLHDAKEHDEFLLKVLGCASNRVLIMSPWLKAHRLAPFKEAMRDAHARGVEVRIYTDLGFNTQALESEAETRTRLARTIDEYADIGVDIRLVRRVHSKVLARDEDLICLGSFNWLSAVREVNDQYHNNESSIAYQGPQVADEIEVQEQALEQRLLPAGVQ